MDASWNVVRIDKDDGVQEPSSWSAATYNLEHGGYKKGTVREMMKTGKEFELANNFAIYKFTPISQQAKH